MAGGPTSGVGRPQSSGPAARRPPVPALGAAAWRPWTVGVAFIGVVGLALVGRAIVATVTGDSAGALVGVGVGVALILLSASVGMALLLANTHGRPTAADFGLRRPPIGRAVGLTLAVWVGLTLATVLWVSALGPLPRARRFRSSRFQP